MFKKFICSILTLSILSTAILPISTHASLASETLGTNYVETNTLNSTNASVQYADTACDNMNSAASITLNGIFNKYATGIKNGKPSKLMCLEKWKSLNFNGILSLLSIAAIIDMAIDKLISAAAAALCKFSDALFDASIGQLNAVVGNGNLMIPGGLGSVQWGKGTSSATIPNNSVGVIVNAGSATPMPAPAPVTITNNTTSSSFNISAVLSNAANAVMCTFGRCQ